MTNPTPQVNVAAKALATLLAEAAQPSAVGTWGDALEAVQINDPLLGDPVIVADYDTLITAELARLLTDGFRNFHEVLEGSAQAAALDVAGTVLASGAVAGDAHADADDLVIGDGVSNAGATISVDVGVVGTYGFRRVGSSTVYGGMRYIISGGHRMGFDLDNTEYFRVGIGVFGPSIVSQDLASASIPVDNAFINTVLVGGAVAAAGVAGSDDIVIGDGTGESGITFHTLAAGVGLNGLSWSHDGAGSVTGRIEYDQANNRFFIRTAGTSRLQIDGSRLSPAAAGYDLGQPTRRFDLGYIEQVLVAGAIAADGSAGADDLIIGDGAGDRGMTVFAGVGSSAWMTMTDVTGTQRAGLRTTFSNDNLLFYAAAAPALRLDPGVAFRPEFDGALGLGDDTHEWTGVYGTRMFVANADSTMGSIGADDLVIGDGTNAAVGATIYGTAAGIARWGCSDLLGGAMRGGMQYNFSDDSFHLQAASADIAIVKSTGFMPGASGTPTLGITGTRWSQGYIDQVFVGGAVSADAPAGANNIVIGDGSAASGMHIHSSNSISTYSMGHVAGASRAHVRFLHTSTSLGLGLIGVDKLIMAATLFRPNVTNVMSLGIATSHGWTGVTLHERAAVVGSAATLGTVWAETAIAGAESDNTPVYTDGGGNKRELAWRENRSTTVSAANNDVVLATLAANGDSVSIDLQVTGVRTDGLEAVSRHSIVTYYRNSVGIVTQLTPHMDNQQATVGATATSALVVAGNNVVARINGDALQTFEWVVGWNRRYVGI